MDATEAAVRAIRVVRPTRFTWLARAAPGAPAWVRRALSDSAARGYLVEAMAACIYRGLYLSGRPRPVSATVPDHGSDGWPDPPFRSRLIEANNGCGPWQAGWRAVEMEDAVWHVAREGVTLLAPADACRTHDGGRVIPGSEIDVRLPKDLTGYSPGYYMALGDEPSSVGTSQPGVRVYWHLAPDGAEPFVRLVTGSLNAEGIPFRLKVLHHPASFDRCDAGVLYVPAAAVSAMGLREALVGPYRSLAPWLRPGTPAWTKLIGHGVGFADDPPRGESFGRSRSRLVAEGIARAREARVSARAERVSMARASMREAGIDPDRPYLNPGSSTWLDPFD